MKLRTARVSVATDTITSIKLKVMMTSSAKAWPEPMEGRVTPFDMVGWKIPLMANDAQREPQTWARIYPGTWVHGKCRVAANARVTAGFKWAPQIWPREDTMIITASPAHAASLNSVSAPAYLRFTIGPDIAANTITKVPTNSAPAWWMKVI